MASDNSARPPALATAEPAGYTVVARRYRPQRFEDVVGQDHVVQSLRNALRNHRVTHAYLFSGTRGVGKTTLARIFAKCLNCVHGPTEEPCLTCENCRAITVGQDVDVIEIDGASNNGVDSVRELRQNAGVAPAKSRFKIYYIDEVHMLSTGAFNALLKTLEEPPERVKFLFATTEPNKIPITVLSRCQRYDLAGIAPEQIVETLAEICRREGIDAEPEALRTVARRASGSMRDAQSLLEQLLSSGTETLTVEWVHKLLGTASDERLLDLIDALADHDAAAALAQLDRATNAGVQPTDLLNGLLEFLRDVLVLAAGAEHALLTATPRQRPRLDALVRRWPLDAVLAALQILAETRGRLRGSAHGRLLVELGLVRVARLEDLGALGPMIDRLLALEGAGPAVAPGGGGAVAVPAAPAEKKKVGPPEAEPGPTPTPPPAPRDEAPAPTPEPAPPPDAPPLDLEAVRLAWPELAGLVGLKLGKGLSQVRPTAIAGPNVLVIRLPARYNWVAAECQAREAKTKIEDALRRLYRRPLILQFETVGAEAGADRGGGPAPTPPEATRRAGREPDPMIQKVVQLFEARPVYEEPEEDPPPSLVS